MLNLTREKSTLPGLAPGPEGTFDVRVVEPGDDVNLYEFDTTVDALRLSGVYRTRRPAPADLAILPDTSADGQSDLAVLLVTHRATLPGCVVKARPIGVLELRDGQQPDWCIIAVPPEDEGMRRVLSVDDLPEARRLDLMAYVQTKHTGAAGGSLRWGDAAEASRVIYEARRAARAARARSRRGGAAIPAWKPLGSRVAGATRASDTEPYTEAERAYLQLPNRFQRYVDDYLAYSERILFAVHRPAMKSNMRRTWLTSQTLQEGIMFITDQQVALVTENLPPDRAGIKYGYVVHTGAPERVESAEIKPVGRSACFEIILRAAGGRQRVMWEFPLEAADELNEAARVVRRWRPVPGSCSLRRAQGPKPIDMRLHDPAANDPSDVWPVAARLQDALASRLATSERLLAGALLPAWADHDNVAHLLAVSDHRLLWLPDADSGQQMSPAAYELRLIASLEFTSSILASWLALNVVEQGEVKRITIAFPYTAADFQTCFTALRQQLPVVPDCGARPGG
jgi:inorganic pyrophosphatase